jgi:ABC-2 type transport system permease protein
VVFKLQKTLGSGDSLRLNFTFRNRPNTLFSRNSNVLANGTHLKSDMLPSIGFDSETNELAGTRLHHYQRADSDRVQLEVVVSTAPVQTVIAPGYLVREWRERGRHFFHYKTDHDIKLVFSVLSGEYALQQENYRGVDLRIYHHPQHIHNLPQMLAGLKAALDYHTAFFGPYQHRQAQVIEFPRSEGTYATTAANCIPISEVRFLNDGRNLEAGAVDIAFYVAAHELAHQWWGNQLVPADAPGATMLTESIAEYVTAKVYEKQYGKTSALRFLDIQRNRYREGRANESGKESPLTQVRADQSYIAYGKGALAFYTLSERIGETRLNGALRSFLEKHQFQGPPYPTSLDLLEYLKQATPDSLQYLVRDLFEKTGPVD